MAAVHELAAMGIPPAPAFMLGQQLTTGIAAAGTTQGTATQLKTSGSRVDTVAANSGVLLPQAGGQPESYVMNNGLNVLTVYPATGQTINGQAVNIGIQIAPGKVATLYPHDTTWFVNVGA